MIIQTVSGSRYEIDSNKKNIRRLSGAKAPTTRQGNDGEWKQYVSISPVEVGQVLIIVWDDNTPLLEGSAEGSLRTTMTSYVKLIEDEVSYN